ELWHVRELNHHTIERAQSELEAVARQALDATRQLAVRDVLVTGDQRGSPGERREDVLEDAGARRVLPVALGSIARDEVGRKPNDAVEGHQRFKRPTWRRTAAWSQ